VITPYLKNIVYQTLSEIVNIQRKILIHKLVSKSLKKFYGKFTVINNKIKTDLTFYPNRYCIPDFKLYWEQLLIKDLTRYISEIENRYLDKQGIKIINIFIYLKNRLPLILESSRFYLIIRTSIQKISSLSNQSQILSSKCRRKLEVTFKDYLRTVSNWKKMRYHYIWLSKQLPLFFEHHQLLVEYLFPKNYL